MNKLKKDSMKFMEKELIGNKKEENIINLKDLEDWKNHVVSSTKPIVLDCYADWCQPCKQLTPILEEKCKQALGDWKLIKYNIDTLPQLANALQIKSVPTVLLINNGNVIDGFAGIDQNAMNKFFETLTKITGGNKEKNELRNKINQIEENILKNENIAGNISQIQEHLKNERTKNIFGGKLYALLSYCSAKDGKKEESLKYIYEINQKFSDEAKDEDILKLIKMAENEINLLNQKKTSDPKLRELEEKLILEPQKNEIRFDLAELQFNNGIHLEAIENCLDIIKIERNWNQNKAQKLLLEIFAKLGSGNSLVTEGRKKLQRILH